jgi:hypothetical protein
VKFYEKHGIIPHENKPENKRAAVVLEGTSRWFFPIVLSNFKYFLGDEWNFYIFHTQYNKDFVVPDGWDCPTYVIDVPRITIPVYNEVYKSTNFWNTFTEDTVLSFEADSILCKPYEKKWEQYDMIGAPCGTDTFNGGLCLRNRRKSLEAIKYFKYFAKDEQEDVAFTNGMRLMEARLPNDYEAALFSVESHYYSLPFGVHGTDKSYLPTSAQEKIVEQIKF